MTAQAKRRLIHISAIVSAIVAIAGWVVRSSAQTVDARYVHASEFTVYQQAQALRRQADSLGDLRRDSLLSRIDSRLASMYCASLPPAKRPGCQ